MSLRDNDNQATEAADVCQFFTPALAPKAPAFNFQAPADEIDHAIQAFLNGATSGKFGRYVIDGAKLCYRLVVTETLELRGDRGDRETEYEALKAAQAAGQVKIITVSPRLGEHRTPIEIMSLRSNTVALRVNRPAEVIYLGNSASLPLIGRRVAFGRERLNRLETDVQSRLALLIPMIPFAVFDQAGLVLAEVNIKARGDAETITRKIPAGTDKKTGETLWKDESVHFTGASLFEIDGRFFLFDVDRRELQHKIFNPFLVELIGPAASIPDAYEGLKPDAVKAAFAAGLEVQRQGEWFFIPMADFDASPAKARNGVDMRFELRAGQNRPNYAKHGVEVDGRVLVKGDITHSGREHEDLLLKIWHLAVPNTATRSFTITGDID